MVNNVRTFFIYLMFIFPLRVFGDVSDAREALSKKDTDISQEKSLEEVFEAAENNYSLIKKGDITLNYNMSYSYAADQRINVDIQNEKIVAFDVEPSTSHTLTNNFNFDYGFKNNITLGVSIPMVVKYDSYGAKSATGVGDVAINMRWQPYAYIPGELSKTVSASIKTKTGSNPFKTVGENELSTGSGYYQLSGGMSFSKIVDPVMLYGTSSFTYALPESDVNQPRSGAILTDVSPGVTVSFAGGFAYSLSYDVSMSMSFQGNYTDKSKYTFLSNEISTEVDSSASMSGIYNISLGVRVSPETITNIGMGFGLTDDAPDILLSFSMPIDVNGLKAKSSNRTL